MRHLEQRVIGVFVLARALFDPLPRRIVNALIDLEGHQVTKAAHRSPVLTAFCRLERRSASEAVGQILGRAVEIGRQV